ncbi:hypothetical protein CXY01_03900 [Cellulomonas xylanilytica]|uniref:ApeA N-terminal domain-containing protein n=1 Tax=Cellulomonas xylanilytica TaxID=233583 RepID=A0A510V3K1_9CELL|nr:hypothetical protein CXY01_03900 [Cellulomonas xylanilytica]
MIATLDENGVEVVWPEAIDMFEAFTRDADPYVPDPLILRNGSGWLTVQQGRSLGTSASSLGHSEHRIRYYRAVSAGARGVDYASVNGMQSSTDGLAAWAQRTPVTQEVRWEEASKGVVELTIRARNLDGVPLGGPLGLELTTSYTHSPEPTGGVYSISTALEVRTRSAEPVAWDTHASAHRMIQDLMCLVYGQACSARIGSVMHEDDQETAPTDERRLWRDAYQPTFGRSSRGATTLTDRVRPLFYLSDTKPDRVSTWLSEYALWSRPTWIGVTPLFHQDLPVESRLLHIAVALEALGAAIAQRDRVPPARTFTRLLTSIIDSIGFAPSAVVGSESIDGWCRAFNAAYKGVKHADNALPDALDAYERAKQGLTLLRCWLAVELGVSPEVLQTNLSEGR